MIDKRVTTDFLKHFELFANLTDDDLILIASIIMVREFREGERIIVENEYGSQLYILIKGEIEITQRMTLELSKSSDDERNKSLARLNAGMYVAVGETSLYDEGKRTATVRAATEVVMGCIERADLLAKCYDYPRLGFKLFYNLGRILSGRLAKSNANILKLSTAFVLALERGR